jgi:hypothetical protein
MAFDIGPLRVSGQPARPMTSLLINGAVEIHRRSSLSVEAVGPGRLHLRLPAGGPPRQLAFDAAARLRPGFVVPPVFVF